MFPFTQPPSVDLSRLEQILEEQNGLLREMLQALGSKAVTPRTPAASAPKPKIRTEANVFRRSQEPTTPTPGNGPGSEPSGAPIAPSVDETAKAF